MQVLWREALEGNRPITVDEFFYYYKPAEIKQSTSFYQFLSRSPRFSLIKGCSSFDRLWKKEFFFISGNQAGDPIDVDSAPFLPFTSPLGRLRFEGMSFFLSIIYFIQPFFFTCLTFLYIGAAVTHPRLDKFNLDCINQARAFLERSFHNFVTFNRLAAWGLGPEPSTKNLAHEETTR